MSHTPVRVVVLLVALAVPAAIAQTDSGVERSVVRLVNYAQPPSWYTPWDRLPVRESSGSGFVIEGGLVMTNAHVVSDSRLLLLFLHNDPEPHHAEVFRVAHDCDLALVRPLDPSVLKDVPAMSFGGLPRLGTTVETIGYPAGGTRVSSTRGVVSRIEEQLYLHSGADVHLTVQTDAAINPGNSGGPVVQGGSVVGVAFQAIPDLQSTGYFIPIDVIERFLEDVKDGRYDGYPELGLEVADMENPAARARAGMRPDETGVRVHRVMGDSSAQDIVLPGDIVLEVGSRTVANDGTVADGDLRFSFGMLVDRMQVGDDVSVRVLRDGKRVTLAVPLEGYAHGHSNAYDKTPRYYVYGGLVFVPLDIEMVKTFGNDWPSRANKALLHEFLVRPQAEPELAAQERVVLLRRLDHPVNADVAWFRNQVVDRVNGKPILSLEDLVEAIESHEEDFHEITFANYGRFAVLDRRAADAANAEILERYGVVADREL